MNIFQRNSLKTLKFLKSYKPLLTMNTLQLIQVSHKNISIFEEPPKRPRYNFNKITHFNFSESKLNNIIQNYQSIRS
jgi:hypothetical protein